MKLILTNSPELDETQVEIRYPVYDDEVRDLCGRLQQEETFLMGDVDGRQHRIRACDIYYAETVDRRTFLYTKTSVYRSEYGLGSCWSYRLTRASYRSTAPAL